MYNLQENRISTGNLKAPGGEQAKTLSHSKSDTELIQHRDVQENSHDPQEEKEGEVKVEGEIKANGETTEKQQVKQAISFL